MTLHADCTETLARIPLFVGGDLQADEAEAVRAHLATCGACAAREADAGASRARYREALVREPAPDLWPGVRAGLVAGGRLDPSVATTRPFPLRRVAGWVAGLAAGLALALVWAFAPGDEDARTGDVTAELEAPTLAPGAVDPSSGLKRVHPGDDPAFDRANWLVPVHGNGEGAAGGREALVSDPTLNGYR